nr:major pollen allergen Ole e 6-like [Ipomoea trifida]GMD64778.1 major pollen allergen Ole E 6-like [Ipomoea batatas]GMD67468.1 major pollen allergen Ole E 6-like [Ipomoea batatas]GMD69720.1 major pollen allergen Ole E 6-like [Ipomoea batatas]GMD71438.1 major pollen allergen Ole E 6-like [Ipomoea batatas]
MAGAGKLVAVVLVCMVVLSAVNVVPKAEAGSDSKFYKDCYEACNKNCMKGGKGATDCEMNCDSECNRKELASKLDNMA